MGAPYLNPEFMMKMAEKGIAVRITANGRATMDVTRPVTVDRFSVKTAGIECLMALRDLETIQRVLIPYFQTRPDIQVGYLFGSVVSGRMRPDSDVDIAVLVSDRVMSRDPLKFRLKLMTGLMKVLNRDDVDLVLLNQAPPLLAHRILSKGKLIFERSASHRVAFQVRAVNRYLDTQPMRNLYLAYLKKHAHEGRIFGR